MSPSRNNMSPSASSLLALLTVLTGSAGASANVSNMTGKNATLEFIMSLGAGRCTQRLGNTNPFASCSANEDAMACLSNADCEWLLKTNETRFGCYCTFAECNCGDPSQDTKTSSDYDPNTMMLVTIPMAVALTCICLSACVWKSRDTLAMIFGYVLPDFVLKKVAIKEEAAPKREQNADVELPDMTAEEEEINYRKAIEEQENSGLPPRKEFTLSVFIERALHLPISDQFIQDANLVGSADPYVKLNIGALEARTTVHKSTLYPVFDEEFSFPIDRDNPRRRPQEVVLQVWDWDFGKKGM